MPFHSKTIPLPVDLSPRNGQQGLSSAGCLNWMPVRPSPGHLSTEGIDFYEVTFGCFADRCRT
jgi:hypothetical protein